MSATSRASMSWKVAFGRGLARGLGFGLALAVVEAVKNVPLCLRGRYLPPLEVVAVSTVFDLALGLVLGLLVAPLLRIRGGAVWHALALLGLFGALSQSISPEFAFARRMEAMALALLAAVYAVGLACSRRPARLRAAVAVGLLAGLAAHLLPHGLLPSVAPPPRGRSEAPEGAPSLLLIVTDTVRADRVGAYGYDRDTMPGLEKLASQGALFLHARSTSTWTLPAHASMFTGLFPSMHGAHHEHTQLDSERTTLAELLHRYGWWTVAFNANPWLTASSGMTQGFSYVQEAWLALMAPQSSLAYRLGWNLGLVSQDHGGEQVVEGWERWLATRWDGQHAFFAFLNVIEAHSPYHQLPAGFRDRYLPPDRTHAQKRKASDLAQGAQFFGSDVPEADAAIVRDLYDAGILYTDHLVERAVEALRARGALDDTVVVVLSDHGELLGEQGLFGHETSLSAHLLDVPLAVRYPRRVPAGLRVEMPVTTAALFPTLLDLLGIPVPGEVPVRSLVPLFDGAAAELARSPLLAEQHGFEPLVPGSYRERGPFDRIGVRYRAFEEEGWKLVVDSQGHRWLFDRNQDPGEENDLATAHPEIVERLEQRLSTIVEAYRLGALDAESLGGKGEVELDPEALDRLKALGYAN